MEDQSVLIIKMINPENISRCFITIDDGRGNVLKIEAENKMEAVQILKDKFNNLVQLIENVSDSTKGFSFNWDVNLPRVKFWYH